MLKPFIIKIFGNVSTGKSVWAQEICRRADAAGMKTMVFDHELFSFEKGFQKRLKKTIDYIKTEKPDFAVIVVGTGLNASPCFTISVDHDGYGAEPMFDLFFNPTELKHKQGANENGN